MWEEEEDRFDPNKISAEDWIMPPVMETKAVLVLLLSLVCGPFSIFTESWVYFDFILFDVLLNNMPLTYKQMFLSGSHAIKYNG